MQTVGTIASRKTGSVYHKPGGTEHIRRSGAKKKDCSTKRCCNSFLKTSVVSIAPQVVTCDWQGEECNYVTKKNYRYLLKSATKYATLLGVGLNHNPGKSIGEGISNLYDELDNIIGELNLNIEPKGDRLEFVIWKYHPWRDFTFYWLPVKFAESLNPRLKKIALTFINNFMHSNGMETTNRAADVEWLLEGAKDNVDECDTKERKRLLKLIDSYESGKIYRLMKKIESDSRHYKFLPAVLEKYSPNNEFETELIRLFKEGLQFIGKDKPSIMSYGYDPMYDQERDYPPVDMDKMVRVVYDVDDVVTEWLMEWTNNELRESYDISPVTWVALSPGTDKLFSMDQYPDHFFKWFDNFCTLIA